MPSMPQSVISLRERVGPCTLCPRSCRVDRLDGQRGACGIGTEAVLASAGPHFGEERVLVGSGGSGTVFFAGCNLHCVFCQNSDISRSDRGQTVSPYRLGLTALELQRRGCENVNFVSPTHVTHAVAEAVVHARHGGLRVPVVYNCGGYESLETLRLLEGFVDIYMPDFKYADEAPGREYSGVEDYPAVAAAALEEMYRQVGRLETTGRGVATRGTLVRHLVMPGDVARSRAAIEQVAAAAPGCAINVMGQYRPTYRAGEFSELSRRPARADVQALREYAAECGLRRVDG